MNNKKPVDFDLIASNQNYDIDAILDYYKEADRRITAKPDTVNKWIKKAKETAPTPIISAEEESALDRISMQDIMRFVTEGTVPDGLTGHRDITKFFTLADKYANMLKNATMAEKNKPTVWFTFEEIMSGIERYHKLVHEYMNCDNNMSNQDLFNSLTLHANDWWETWEKECLEDRGIEIANFEQSRQATTN